MSNNKLRTFFTLRTAYSVTNKWSGGHIGEWTCSLVAADSVRKSREWCIYNVTGYFI